MDRVYVDGAAVTQARKVLRLPQKRLAERLGISERSLRSVEKGGPVRLEVAENLASLLKLSFAAIKRGSVASSPPPPAAPNVTTESQAAGEPQSGSEKAAHPRVSAKRLRLAQDIADSWQGNHIIWAVQGIEIDGRTAETITRFLHHAVRLLEYGPPDEFDEAFLPKILRVGRLNDMLREMEAGGVGVYSIYLSDNGALKDRKFAARLMFMFTTADGERKIIPIEIFGFPPADSDPCDISVQEYNIDRWLWGWL